MIQQLNARTLPDLSDGQAELIINSAINQAVSDLEDRGEQDKKERVVTITLRMAIMKGLTTVDVAAKVAMPEYRTQVTSCKKTIRKEGGVGLLFSGFSADNPDQPTFREMEDVTPELAEGELPE